MMSVGCLCAPTTHAGSFRCRLHRKPPSSSPPPSSLLSAHGDHRRPPDAAAFDARDHSAIKPPALRIPPSRARTSPSPHRHRMHLLPSPCSLSSYNDPPHHPALLAANPILLAANPTLMTTATCIRSYQPNIHHPASDRIAAKHIKHFPEIKQGRHISRSAPIMNPHVAYSAGPSRLSRTASAHQQHQCSVDQDVFLTPSPHLNILIT